MALRAKYEADFQEFYGAVDKANAGLEAWEQSGAAVERQMNDIAGSLPGANIAANAGAAASAVDDIADSAGQVPPALERIGSEASTLPAVFSSIAATAAAAFTVQQILNFGASVIETAGNIGDMSEKLGVSAEAIQRFGYAADQAGSDIGTVERAIGNMNRILGEGSNSTIAALQDAGLEFENIRDLAPEDAFTAIADAVAAIPDPMTRAKVATELFGKAGADLIPAFLAGIKQVGSETAVMSDETIKRLKAAEDAWGRLKNAVVIHTGEIIASTMKSLSSWKEFALSLATAAVPGGDWIKDVLSKNLVTTAEAAESATSAVKGLVAPALAIPSAYKPAADAVAFAATEIKAMNTAATFSTQVIGLMEPKLGSLSTFVRNSSKEMERAADYNETWNQKLRFTSEVIGEKVNPEIQELITNIKQVETLQSNASKNAPGGVGVNTGGISFGSISPEAALKLYTQKYGTGSAAGLVGGGIPPDFLSWAMSMGYASKAPAFPNTSGGAPINNTFNIVDTESEIARRVAEEINRQVRSGSLVNV